MAAICPNCGSHDVQHSIGDRAQCVNCGALLNAKGEQVNRGPDETTRAVMEARLQPRRDNVVGNFADVQRLADESTPTVTLPPGVDPNNLPGPDSPPATASEVQAAMSSTHDVSEGDDGYREAMDPAKAAAANASREAAANLGDLSAGQPAPSGADVPDSGVVSSTGDQPASDAPPPFEGE